MPSFVPNKQIKGDSGPGAFVPSSAGPKLIGVSKTPTKPKKKGGGGFLGGLGHVFSQGGKDLYNVAVHAPGGLVAAGEAVGSDVTHGIRDIPRNAAATVGLAKPAKAPSKTTAMLEASAKQVASDLRHPLRHPGNTLLDVLPVFNAAGRVVEGASVLRAGEGVGAAAKATVGKVKPPPRELTAPGTDYTVRGHYSRAAGARVVQKAVDRTLEKKAASSVRAENQLHRRMAKWETRNQRVGDAKARAPGTMLDAAGAKLKPHELRAIRLVAEEVPVERRIAAQEMRKSQAKGSEVGRHQQRIDLTRQAQDLLTADSEGRPVFKAGESTARVRRVYELLQRASKDREGMLARLDLMDEQAAQAAKVKTARIAAGQTGEMNYHGSFANPEHGRASPGDTAGFFTSAEESHANFYANSEQRNEIANQGHVYGAQPPKNPIDLRDTVKLRKVITQAKKEIAAMDEAYLNGEPGAKSAARAKAAILRAQKARIAGDIPLADAHLNDAAMEIGAMRGSAFDKSYLNDLIRRMGHDAYITAERNPATDKPAKVTVYMDRPPLDRLVTPSENAVHIGNPARRSKVTGKVRASSTGTLGHTRKPTSLRKMTGHAVEHANERNDVTRIVAERHAEAVRLTKLDRLIQSVKPAGELAPRRPDDVFVWTDKLISNKRIPADVREFLDHPESLQKLDPHEQMTVFDRIKQATLQTGDWRDPTKRAELEAAAKKGQGVFVPRRLLGEAGRRDFNLGAMPGMKFVDAVNNAQKMGLVYLKLNYPIIQGLSNVAMGLIHQGFALPANLTRAVRLEHAVGPELAGVIDDIMGQGAVMQAQIEGKGAIAHLSQTVASKMTHGVDTPARRAAFLHEARKAGYGTPEKLKALIEDDANAGDLAEVAQRAKEAIVDYGNLGPVERNVIRRLIFVYPWQKGATVYAAHFLRDHPAQAAALGEVGVIGKQTSDQQLGPVPSYLDGVFKVGGKLVNPAGVNFFQTPAQIGQAVAGTATGNPAQASAGLGFLSPAPGLAAGLLSGVDSIGRPLKGNIGAKARDLTIAQTPLAQVIRGVARGSHGAPGDLARAALGTGATSKTFPNPGDPYWRFLFGGLYPRKFSRATLNQNAAREKTGR